jgi:hypothetical protein
VKNRLIGCVERECEECRFRQTEIDSITVEIGGRESITADEEAALKKVITKATDPAFNVNIRPTKKIDWSGNPKRPFFVSSIESKLNAKIVTLNFAIKPQ